MAFFRIIHWLLTGLICHVLVFYPLFIYRSVCKVECNILLSLLSSKYHCNSEEYLGLILNMCVSVVMHHVLLSECM